MLLEVYNSGLCISLHLQIIQNQWNTGMWMKTPMLMCLKIMRKITHDHLSMQKHMCVRWMKYRSHTHIKGI